MILGHFGSSVNFFTVVCFIGKQRVLCYLQKTVFSPYLQSKNPSSELCTKNRQNPTLEASVAKFAQFHNCSHGVTLLLVEFRNFLTQISPSTYQQCVNNAQRVAYLTYRSFCRLDQRVTFYICLNLSIEKIEMRNNQKNGESLDNL